MVYSRVHSTGYKFTITVKLGRSDTQLPTLQLLEALHLLGQNKITYNVKWQSKVSPNLMVHMEAENKPWTAADVRDNGRRNGLQLIFMWIVFAYSWSKPNGDQAKRYIH
ncbi:hypothetical protein F0562_021838 [Nyssa sinensis]|uniref:Uncharacterized protein n=1 Tax=Nyssa sinensis TaxID=561372 RepID=A0A5J5BLI0_9ASTE|nr:hypothetical protein F0562_021838 [Nyssa sinensis]